MKIFSTLSGGRWLKPAVLALGLLAAGASQAQAQPSTVYALGTITKGFTYLGTTYATGSQVLANVSPTSGTLPTIPMGGFNYPVIGQPITGILGTQALVGIDFRPSTGDLYALGYDASATFPAPNSQVYTLNTTTGVLTAVGSPLALRLSDSLRNNTRGVIPNISFDFNPRVDRIRVMAPNAKNYRINPNNPTQATTIRDSDLFYAAGAVTPTNTIPYVGTAAYTNSRLGLSGTTLFDIDVTNGKAILSTQAPPNAGQLNPTSETRFVIPPDPGSFPITSPTVGLGLDVYGTTTAYLVEARLQKNDENVGPDTNYTSNFYSFNLSTGQATRIANIIGGVTLFYSDIAAPIQNPKTWTGATSIAWNDGTNWFPNGIPTATDDVVIPGNGTFVAAANATVARQPTVSTTQPVGSVTLINGAVLTTANGSTLNVSTTFTNNDSQVQGSGTGTVALVGTDLQEISGNTATTFQNLSVGSAGATTASAVSIARSLSVTGTLTIGTGQAFTLLSSASGTAYVVNNAGGTVTGVATVQRYITPSNPGLGYRHYSSPVTRNAAVTTSNTINDLTTLGFAPTVNPAYNSAAAPRLVQPYPTVFTYNQARLATSNASYAVGDFDNGFISPNALTDVLATGVGYAVNIGGSQLVDFQGTLNTGNYSNGPLMRGAQSAAGWQLLGNPYPGAINYDVVLAASPGLESALYVAKSNGQYTGTYSSYVNGAGNNTGTNNIPVGQGFFVRVAPGQTATMNFTNAARTGAPETSLFQRSAADLRPTLALTVGNASVANQTRVYFEQGATSAFDAAYDAHYLPATHGLDLATDISTEVLSINGLPALGSTTTVPLYLHAAVAGTYTLTVDELANLPIGYHAYLRDSRTNTYTDLATTPSLSLALAPADAPVGRYALVFATSHILATAPATLAALVSVYPNPAHGSATLVLPQALRGQAASEVAVVNALGQVVLHRPVAAGAAEQVELPLGSLAPGLYTVRATTATGTIAKQLQVQ